MLIVDIVCVSMLQLVGCVYMQALLGKLCWLVQLLSIVCIRAGQYQSSTQAPAKGKGKFFALD